MNLKEKRQSINRSIESRISIILFYHFRFITYEEFGGFFFFLFFFVGFWTDVMATTLMRSWFSNATFRFFLSILFSFSSLLFAVLPAFYFTCFSEQSRQSGCRQGSTEGNLSKSRTCYRGVSEECNKKVEWGEKEGKTPSAPAPNLTQTGQSNRHYRFLLPFVVIKI